MRRLSWLAALLLWLGAAAPASAVPTLAEQNFAPAQAQRMNIVLITADDLGKSLGTYGDPLAQTPHLDALAARGVLFERAWVTQASCSSSRASMLTGLYPHQHGQIGLAGQHAEFSLRRGLTTLPGLLRCSARGFFFGILAAMLYFIHGVMEAATADLRSLALWETGFAVAMVMTCSMAMRRL